MSAEFKGIKGGDPSRKPKPVIVTYTCKHCGQSNECETRIPNKFTPPDYCNGQCKMQAGVSKVIHDLSDNGYENIDPSTINQQWAAKYNSLNHTLTMMKSNLHLVVNGEYTCSLAKCAQCEVVAPRVHKSQGEQAPKYCSYECRASAQKGLPTGTFCRSVHKQIAMDTLEQMEEELVRVNRELAEAGDHEGLTPYLCTCGKWHGGHNSKAAFDAPVLDLIKKVEDELYTLVIANLNRTQRNKYKAQQRATLLTGDPSHAVTTKRKRARSGVSKG